MQRWDLTAAHESDREGPRVLFSTPEARVVVIDLAADEELGDHRVRERAILQVFRGSVAVNRAGDTSTCAEGTLVVFDAGESHGVRALESSRLLLTLAPWPAPGHYEEAEGENAHALPANATQGPLDDRPS